MKYTTLNSSAISGVGYDAKQKRMEVIFHNGSSIFHDDVSRDNFDDFIASDSPGKYYTQNFRKPKQKVVERKIKW